MRDCNTVLFFREDVFYPIEFLSPQKCGKTLERQAADHAELNPGTQKVETVGGHMLWKAPAQAKSKVA